MGSRIGLLKYLQPTAEFPSNLVAASGRVVMHRRQEPLLIPKV
jgi:hypothetical protein